jgi:hypothetical protein
VSFLTRLFGSPEEKSRLTMRQIAEALAIQNPEIAFDGEGIGSLKAVWKGASLHVRYGEGGIQRCTLSHSFLKHGFDLESDLDRRNEPIEALPDPSSKRSGERDGQAHLGGGLFCDRADLRNFARLPEDLRSRMPQALIKARVCYFRAGNGNFDATFHLDSDNSPGQDHLIRALTLAMEVCEARGILSTPEAQAPVTTAGANVESRVYSPLSVARGCARKMPGATVEDLGGTGREGIWARVSFDHEGCAMRLVFYRFDEFMTTTKTATRTMGTTTRTMGTTTMTKAATKTTTATRTRTRTTATPAAGVTKPPLGLMSVSLWGKTSTSTGRAPLRRPHRFCRSRRVCKAHCTPW